MTPVATLQVTHETRYEYASRVELAHHLAYLRPCALAFQSVEAYALMISPEPSFLTHDVDPYSNARVFFSHYLPHRSLLVRAQSTVQVGDRYAGLGLTGGVPWETVRESLRYAPGVPWNAQSEYVFASPFVLLHAELRDYAASSFPAGRSLREGAVELMHRIYEDFTYESESTDISTPLIEAFRMRRGVCQDFAHVMISCLRSLGLAARYVSGYLMTVAPAGRPRLTGADASHAWAQVYCPDLGVNEGWLDLDPTNDLIPGAGHVTLAQGRDYGDVAPLRGIIRGGGEHQLEVGVSVEPVAALELDRT